MTHNSHPWPVVFTSRCFGGLPKLPWLFPFLSNKSLTSFHWNKPIWKELVNISCRRPWIHIKFKNFLKNCFPRTVRSLVYEIQKKTIYFFELTFPWHSETKQAKKLIFNFLKIIIALHRVHGGVKYVFYFFIWFLELPTSTNDSVTSNVYTNCCKLRTTYITFPSSSREYC